MYEDVGDFKTCPIFITFFFTTSICKGMSFKALTTAVQFYHFIFVALSCITLS